MPDTMAAPLILAFDTSGPACAAALLAGDTILTERYEPMARGQAERLVPLLQELLEETGHDWSGLTALAVGTGPGNFTGLRISVALARGLALALGIPAIGVTGFDALAHGHVRPVLATLPAPRAQLYGQRIDTDDSASAPQMFPEGEIPEALRAPTVLSLGEGVSLAPAIARVAAARLDQPAVPPAPFYLRPADAAPPRDAPPRIIP